MEIELNLRPKNSLLLLMDVDCGMIPQSMNRALVAATESSVAVGSASEFDRDTKVILTDGAVDSTGLHLVFKGEILFPRKVVNLVTTDLCVQASCVVNENIGQVLIYANDLREPDHLVFKVN